MSGPVVIRDLYPSRIDATIVVFNELVQTVTGDNANNEFDLVDHGYPNDLAFKFTGTPPSPAPPPPPLPSVVSLPEPPPPP